MRANQCLAAAAVVAALVLAGCSREADKAARPDAEAAASAASEPTTGSGYADRSDRTQDRAPVKAFADGKPMWASSRRRSAERGRSGSSTATGADFGAGTLDGLCRQGPRLRRRSAQGRPDGRARQRRYPDYDPKANVFAVADRQGAPRTMFKPRDGRAYWDQQKQSLADRAAAAARAARATGAGARTTSNG
ncbi:MAG: hypothetical protein WDM92_11115 [Caulobacteraceae bacterium]